ncbi:MAG: FUSC family protein [Aliidongia sp.]
MDELECVASVLLAIVFGHLADARNISWAAYSGYMVMRGHISESLLRGVLRIVGTGAGALLALALVRSCGPARRHRRRHWRWLAAAPSSAR